VKVKVLLLKCLLEDRPSARVKTFDSMCCHICSYFTFQTSDFALGFLVHKKCRLVMYTFLFYFNIFRNFNKIKMIFSS
jgi:hypothetical protein